MLKHIGEYLLLMKQVFSKPEKKKILLSQIMREFDSIGVDSLVIVMIISLFMGAVTALQLAFNLSGNPVVPTYTIGYATRETIVLEFSPTIVCLILAGKIGSRIASEIGTMRVTEQIDALEIMGINSANYLIQPKIIASLIIIPVLIAISMFLAILGGWLAGIFTGLFTSHDYIYGIQSWYHTYEIVYAFEKTFCFAFIISSVSGYFGYITKGGALEVGQASTKAVVNSSILIIIFNLILTQLLLA
ncbi:MAG: ABC transporter permease [Bacteroidales bacterium]|nr:ABC transporter permease [Bacteroidales bacterium]